MKVEIRWMPNALNNFRILLERLPMSSVDRRRYARFLTQYVIDELKRTAGEPPSSIKTERVHPETRGWELIGSKLWLVLVVRRKRYNLITRWLGLASVEVIIHAALNRVPTPNELGIRPS